MKTFVVTIAFVFMALAFSPAWNRASASPAAGRVVGWGNDPSGQATGIPHVGASTGLVAVAGSELTNAIAISGGVNHSLALRQDGTVVGWGWNKVGQATGVRASDPECGSGVVTISGQTLTNVAAISAGASFSLALRKDGTVVSWGIGPNGQEAILRRLSNVVAISAADADRAMALKSDGTIVWWGTNPRNLATPPASLSNLVAIACAREQTLALTSDGHVIRWGYDRRVPEGLHNVVAIAVGSGAFGGGHCLALRSDGTVVGWGTNAHGEATPPVGLSNVVAIAAGGMHSLALKKDGTVVAWGDNRWHQTDVPAALSNVVAVAAGETFSLAIVTNTLVLPSAPKQ